MVVSIETVPERMNALVYTGTEQVRYQHEPVREPGDGEVLLKVDAVGICGSDMHAYHGHDPRRVPPMILGHEACGTLLTGPHAGRRATFNPIAFCGHCDYCLDGMQNLCSNRTMVGMSLPGAFAEYVTVPAQCLILCPEGMDPAVAALTEPTATALHAVEMAERVLATGVAGLRALVIGAGSIGLLIAGLLRHRGCGTVDIGDTNPLRRETARAAGYGSVYDPSATPPAADHYHLVFDAVGAGVTRESAVAAVRPGGAVVHVGLLQGRGDLDVRKLTLAEVRFVGVYTYTHRDLAKSVELLHQGALGGLDWMEQRPLRDGPEAFASLHDGSTAAAKIVLRPW